VVNAEGVQNKTKKGELKGGPKLLESSAIKKEKSECPMGKGGEREGTAACRSQKENSKELLGQKIKVILI